MTGDGTKKFPTVNLKRIIRCFFCYLCCALAGVGLSLIPAVTAFPEEGARLLTPEERDAFLLRLETVQRDIRTLQAEFSEQRKIASIKTPLSFSGKLYYARDGLFFMAYENPIQYILRVEGQEVIMYVEGSTTADVVQLPDMKGFAGPKNLFAWDPKGFTGNIWEDADGYRLVEHGGKKDRAEEKPVLDLVLDKETLIVKKVRIADGSGDITELSLSAVEIDAELPLHVREYKLPQGVQLNRLNQQ